MMFQIDKPMTETEWNITIIALIVLLFIIIISIIVFLYTYLSNKIHSSYHKGYNKAKSDKVEYYKTIKKLIDSFKRILFELEKDNIKPSIITTQLLIDFKNSLQNYYNN